MRAVLQRVAEASVTVAGRTVARIGEGLLVLVGAMQGDGEADADYVARKIAEVRLFPDAEGKMNRSVEEVGGGVLVVSQFTRWRATAARAGDRRSPTRWRPSVRRVSWIGWRRRYGRAGSRSRPASSAP